MTTARPTPEALLEHGDFLRALAHKLLRDEHLAEDAVQQTFAQALTSPPRREGARAWLATVLRNLVHNSQRADRRREARERSAAQPSMVPSADEIHQREALRQRVVQSVLQLPEPYRATILLRYFEHMTPGEIARHDGVPASTVRTRLSRGHELLRQRLDDAHGGDRRRWLIVMAPWARHFPSGATAAPALAVSLLAMKKIAAVLVALLGAALVYFAMTGPSIAPDSVVAAGPSEPGALAAPSEKPSEASRRPVADAPPVEAPARGEATELPATFAAALAGFRGRVLHADGTPAADCELELYRLAMDAVLGADGLAPGGVATPSPRLRAGEARTSGDGTFAIEGVRPRGLFVLRCGPGSEEQSTRVVQRAPAPGEVVDLGDIVLTGVTVLTGTAVDDEGAPVVDAEVRAVDLPSAFLSMLPLLAFDPEGAVAVRRNPPAPESRLIEVPSWARELWRSLPVPSTRTGPDGTFRLAGAPPGRMTLAVTKPGLLAALRANVLATPGETRDLGEVRLAGGEELFVSVSEHDGAAVAGAEVMAGATSGMQPFDALRRAGMTNDQGELSATGFPRGQVMVAVRRNEGDPWITADPQPIGRDVEITLPARFTLDVRLVSEGNRAVSRPSCELLPTAGPGTPEMTAFGAQRPLDLEGRLDVEERHLRIRDLPGGEYTLVVRDPGHGRSAHHVRLTKDTVLEIALPARIEHRVRVVDAQNRPVERATVYARLAPTPAWPSAMPVASGFTGADGVHEADDLPSRPLEFTASHPAFGVAAAAPLASEITTIVLAAPGAIEGEVHERGRPPEEGTWMAVAMSKDEGLRGTVQTFPLLAMATNGSFRFPSLQPGEYTLHVTKAFAGDMTLGAVYEFGRYAWMPSERPPVDVEVVSKATARVTLDAAGPPPEETRASIRGTITVDDRPGAGMIVVCDSEENAAPKMAKTDGQGAYEIRGVDPGTREMMVMEVEEQSMLDKQPHKLWVGTVEVSAEAAATRDVAVRTGSIAGIVTGPDGPATKAWVVLQGSIETESGLVSGFAKSQWSVIADDEGAFEIVRVPAGQYRVRAHLPSNEEMHGELPDVELGPGAMRSDLRVVLAPR